MKCYMWKTAPFTMGLMYIDPRHEVNVTAKHSKAFVGLKVYYSYLFLYSHHK